MWELAISSHSGHYITPVNNCLVGSLSGGDLSFHLPSMWYTADARSAAGRVYESEVCSRSGCTVGEFKAKAGRETAAGSGNISALLTWKWL